MTPLKPDPLIARVDRLLAQDTPQSGVETRRYSSSDEVVQPILLGFLARLRNVKPAQIAGVGASELSEILNSITHLPTVFQKGAHDEKIEGRLTGKCVDKDRDFPLVEVERENGKKLMVSLTDLFVKVN